MVKDVNINSFRHTFLKFYTKSSNTQDGYGPSQIYTRGFFILKKEKQSNESFSPRIGGGGDNNRVVGCFLLPYIFRQCAEQ